MGEILASLGPAETEQELGKAGRAQTKPPGGEPGYLRPAGLGRGAVASPSEELTSAGGISWQFACRRRGRPALDSLSRSGLQTCTE